MTQLQGEHLAAARSPSSQPLTSAASCGYLCCVCILPSSPRGGESARRRSRPDTVPSRVTLAGASLRPSCSCSSHTAEIIAESCRRGRAAFAVRPASDASVVASRS